jgi:hypothetical protein
VPGPCEWPECENPREGGPGVVEGGRLKFIEGAVKMRAAGAPSAGQVASAPASRMDRDTSNSSSHAVQRKA